MTNTLHDRDIREPLFDFLEETYVRIRIIEEKTKGKSRADIVLVLDDALCGIEIQKNFIQSGAFSMMRRRSIICFGDFNISSRILWYNRNI